MVFNNLLLAYGVGQRHVTPAYLPYHQCVLDMLKQNSFPYARCYGKPPSCVVTNIEKSMFGLEETEI